VSAGHDEELLRQLLEGGRPGEHAGLELLLCRRPQSWEDAVALLEPVGVASRRALDALTEAWRTYRRIERSQGASGP
jgi:hypothetical protein